MLPPQENGYVKMIRIDLFAVLSAFCTLSAAQSCWQEKPCTGPSKAAFSGPWEKNHYSPSSRTASPINFFPLNQTSTITAYPAVHTLVGNASAVVYDFGKEVGGIGTVRYTTTGDAGKLGLSFTEAKNWIGLASDSSNGPFAHGIGDQACGDGAIYDIFSSSGDHGYTMESKHMRGGFRYLTLFLLTNGTTSLAINSVELSLSFAPTWSNLQAYQGYFHSSDEELNKIWYAGAYTLQTNIIPFDTGRSWSPPIETGWANNATLSNGTSAIVDGAKRDRTVWPGDMGIAVPSTFVSLGDLEAVMNGLQSQYDHQSGDGELPFAGLPVLAYGGDTYHCWTMIGLYNYVLYTGDMEFLNRNWNGYKRAMEFIYAKVQEPLGLLNVTGTGDWGRLYPEGYCTEANMVLYKTLTTGAEIATWMNEADLAKNYTSRAASLKGNVTDHLYDPAYGAFKDNNTDTTVYPQDANSMSLSFGLVPNDSSTASSISERLTENWTPIGAETPELPDNISPFISSFEIQAHFAIGNTNRALELIRRSWGWYLSNKNGTESTFIEGYLTNGSFGYRNYDGYDWDSSYTSHAHGWSTGPTSALTNFVLGLSVTGMEGKEWTLAPQFGDLGHAEGGFTTGLGKFQASWTVTNGGEKYVLEWKAPSNTIGIVVLPALPAGCEGAVSMKGNPKGKIKGGSTMHLTVDGASTQYIEVSKS